MGFVSMDCFPEDTAPTRRLVLGKLAFRVDRDLAPPELEREEQPEGCRPQPSG